MPDVLLTERKGLEDEGQSECIILSWVICACTPVQESNGKRRKLPYILYSTLSCGSYCFYSLQICVPAKFSLGHRYSYGFSTSFRSLFCVSPPPHTHTYSVHANNTSAILGTSCPHPCIYAGILSPYVGVCEHRYQWMPEESIRTRVTGSCKSIDSWALNVSTENWTQGLWKNSLYYSSRIHLSRLLNLQRETYYFGVIVSEISVMVTWVCCSLWQELEEKEKMVVKEKRRWKVGWDSNIIPRTHSS